MKARALAALVAVLALASVAGSSIAHAGTSVKPLGKFKLPFAGSINSSSSAFKVTNTGSGYAVEAHGNGYAAVVGAGAQNGLYGTTSSNGDSGVYGDNGGAGNGVTGHSATGNGVLAMGSGTNNALAIASGGIEVYQAGIDTPTPVFLHVVAASNLCDNGIYTVLDNPFLNNNPAAFIFLSQSLVSVGAQYGGPNCPSNRWVVYNSKNFWSIGDGFDVLVLHP